MSTTQLTTPELDIDKIDVADGFNARRDFDAEELARLAETIKVEGLVQAVPGPPDRRRDERDVDAARRRPPPSRRVVPGQAGADRRPAPDRRRGAGRHLRASGATTGDDRADPDPPPA